MKVLLVDDEAEFVSALAERLTLRGMDVDWVSRPEEAVWKVRGGCYDIAVLDVKMPRVSGIGLKKVLEKQCPEMKFIFLTGHGSEEAFQAGVTETGSEFYLMKPIRFEKLLETIRSARTEASGEKENE